MLRGPQHERKIPNDIKTPPFVLSTVEGLRRSFSAALLVLCWPIVNNIDKPERWGIVGLLAILTRLSS
jgi:hypothetical protein